MNYPQTCNNNDNNNTNLLTLYQNACTHRENTLLFRIFFFHFRIVPIDFIISIGFDILFPCFALLFQNTFFPFLVVSFSLRKNRILHFGFPEFIDAKFARIHEFVRHIP